MRKVLIIVYSVVAVLILASFFFYKSLYNKQISYIHEMLDRQVQVVGQTIDSISNNLNTEISQISNSSDLGNFFVSPEAQTNSIGMLRIFYSRYKNLVTAIKYYDRNRLEFSMKNDGENEWLEQTFTLHSQPAIADTQRLVVEDRKFEYYIPVRNGPGDSTIANLVVTIDYEKYFNDLFSVFNIREYQWQWIINDEGKIIFSNRKNIEYPRLERTNGGINRGEIGRLTHKAVINGEKQEIISSYYSLQLIQRNLRLIFSSPVNTFQRYLIRTSVFIVLVTLFLVHIIILVFIRYIHADRLEKERLVNSEETLQRLINELPAGLIIFNRNREIVRANKIAASLYSYQGEAEMAGKIYPEIAVPDENDFYSVSTGGAYNPGKFITITKDTGKFVLYRQVLSDVLMDEEVTIEILIDVTSLELALKQETKSSVARSELLARMSYEIRTPLNGIIGMADILNRFDLAPEVRNIASILQRSTEVLLGIVNDVLDFSKIESGSILLDETPFNLRSEIAYCTDLANSSFPGKDPMLSCTVDDNVPEIIIGDPYRLRQVISTLLTLSIKNTSSGEIRLSCTQTAFNNGIATLRFELLDTGRSFDKITLKRIFGDFVNFDSLSLSSREEPGFSTIMTRQLIQLMGGQLTAVSPSGLSGSLGTKVVFTIMVYSGDRGKKEIYTGNISSFNQIRTLVVTGSQGRDEEIIGALHKAGLNVSLTTYIKSTVGQIKTSMNFPESRYNLIVILNDGDFNGFVVAKEIWEENLSGSFLILMISSADIKGNYIKCLSLGVDYYLVKPVEVIDLQKIIMNSFPYVEDKSATNHSKASGEVRLLVVEDNLINQKVMGAMLESLGYEYDVASDGAEGYRKAIARKYNLILMDLIMPEMDGYTSSQKILEHDGTAFIIAFSADNSLDARRKAELAGIKDFISKPVRVADLKKVLDQYL